MESLLSLNLTSASRRLEFAVIPITIAIFWLDKKTWKLMSACTKISQIYS